MPGLIIGDIFANAARATPERIAAVLRGETITFSELDSRGNQVARSLIRLGLQRGARVGTWADMTLDLLPLFVGLAKSGVVFVPLAASLSSEEATAIGTTADLSLLVLDQVHVSEGQAVANELDIAAIDMTGLGDSKTSSPLPKSHSGDLPALVDLASAELRESPSIEVDELDPHVIFFTSGSTGRPKGVVLSHRVNHLRTHPGAQLEPRGAMVCTYPLFHMGAWTISLQQWQARDVVGYVSRADGSEIVGLTCQLEAARLNCIPGVWRRVLETLASEPEGRRTLPSVRFADSGTSATPPELLEAIQKACPRAHLRVFYGATETGNVSSLDGNEIGIHPGGCGTPSPSTEVRLGLDGELQVRGPLLFDGYFADAKATRDVFDGDWYRTGDLAQVGSDGHLSVVGRVRDIIRTGGESVAPLEVEEVLLAIPGIQEAAVVGIPDDTWGEVVCAVLVLSEGCAEPSLPDLRDVCLGRLASHKQPRMMKLVTSLPKTPATGQVRRRELLEMIDRC